jgi:hypothetical protein
MGEEIKALANKSRQRKTVRKVETLYDLVEPSLSAYPAMCLFRPITKAWTSPKGRIVKRPAAPKHRIEQSEQLTWLSGFGFCDNWCR